VSPNKTRTASVEFGNRLSQRDGLGSNCKNTRSKCVLWETIAVALSKLCLDQLARLHCRLENGTRGTDRRYKRVTSPMANSLLLPLRLPRFLRPCLIRTRDKVGYLHNREDDCTGLHVLTANTSLFMCIRKNFLVSLAVSSFEGCSLCCAAFATECRQYCGHCSRYTCVVLPARFSAFGNCQIDEIRYKRIPVLQQSPTLYERALDGITRTLALNVDQPDGC